VTYLRTGNQPPFAKAKPAPDAWLLDKGFDEAAAIRLNVRITTNSPD
jgi:hypothetical protein